MRLSSDPYSVEYALSLSNQTYWAYETFRTMNHDRRWNTHDSLYYGYVPPRVWDGTNIARSSLSMPIVFDQVEAALPVISQAIFGIGPEWFQVEAEPGTNPADAREIQDALAYVMEHPKDELGSSSQAELELAIKQILIYGNGGVSIEWDPVLQRTVLANVDIRDIYVDPGLDTPSIDASRSVIRRRFMTVEELWNLRSDPRMNIPSLEILHYFAKNVPQAPADQTKRVQEAIRGVYFSPGFTDHIPLPSAQKIEVLIYYSKDRIIWNLNKQWIAYNGPNPYNFIPFAFAPCYIVPGRFYAMSIADVQENNQRYIEALINGRLDEISLALHPPRVQKRNSLMTPAQQRWKPGAVFTAENKDEFSVVQQQGATQNIYTEIQYLETAADKRTGITAFNNGVPRPGNAMRTATGVNTVSRGSASRITYLVSNIELYLLIPILYKMQRIMQFHTRPGQALPATSKGGYYNVDAASLQKKVTFKMLAASRMLTRSQLQQIFPFITQYLLQGPVMQGLAQAGKTIDFDVFANMLQDATGIARLYNLVRPMSPQEQQQMQQQQQQAQQGDMQKQQMDAQTRTQIMQMKVQGDLQKAQIMKAPSPAEVEIQKQQMQAELAQKQQEMQLDAQQRQQEMQAEQIMQRIKIEAEKQKNQMKLQHEQAKAQVGMQTAGMQMQSAQAQHQQKMQMMQQQAQAEDLAAQQRQQTAESYPLGSGATAGQEPGAAGPARPASSENRQPRKKEEERHKARPPK